MDSGELREVEARVSGRPLTVGQALQRGAEALYRSDVESPRLDAELLLAKALGWVREQLYVNCERRLDGNEAERFRSLLRRRARGEPTAYITGHREFWSLDFVVTPDVLVPRPETELLVEATLDMIAGRRQGPKGPAERWRLLEVGTGSGAVAIALAKERSDVEIWATDISAGALEVARTNAERHGVKQRTHFIQGNTFEPVESRRGFFHGLVCNPPYVRSGEIPALPREVRDWEPGLALDGGADGLELHRCLVQQGYRYLEDEGFMVLEIGPDMGAEVCRLFGGAGAYTGVSVHRDLTGRDRAVSARRIPRPETAGQEG